MKNLETPGKTGRVDRYESRRIRVSYRGSYPAQCISSMGEVGVKKRKNHTTQHNILKAIKTCNFVYYGKFS